MREQRIMAGSYPDRETQARWFDRPNTLPGVRRNPGRRANFFLLLRARSHRRFAKKWTIYFLHGIRRAVWLR